MLLSKKNPDPGGFYLGTMSHRWQRHSPYYEFYLDFTFTFSFCSTQGICHGYIELLVHTTGLCCFLAFRQVLFN